MTNVLEEKVWAWPENRRARRMHAFVGELNLPGGVLESLCERHYYSGWENWNPATGERTREDKRRPYNGIQHVCRQCENRLFRLAVERKRLSEEPL